MYFDHHGITDEQFAALREHFTEAETVELTWVLVQFIALGKLIYVLGIRYGESGPEAAHDENHVTEGQPG